MQPACFCRSAAICQCACSLIANNRARHCPRVGRRQADLGLPPGVGEGGTFGCVPLFSIWQQAERPTVPAPVEKSEPFMPVTEPGLVSIIPKVDGRRLRSERTRQAIIEAFMRLLRRKPAMPTASQIAQEAGCSTRSVFERFSDLDALSVAAADYAIVQAQAEAIARNVDADRTTRINSHVKTRAFVCEKWLPLWRLIVRQEQPELRKRAAMVRSISIERLKLMYRPGVSRLAELERDRLIMALAALISFESWDLLRHCYNLSMEDAQAVWRSAIDRMLPLAEA